MAKEPNIGVELRLARLNPRSRRRHTRMRREFFAYFEQPVTNAYTESVDGLVRTMNRMGRGYSFEVIRARMLYDPRACADGSELVREASDDSTSSPTLSFKRIAGAWIAKPTRQRVLEYGPHIPTLAR